MFCYVEQMPCTSKVGFCTLEIYCLFLTIYFCTSKVYFRSFVKGIRLYVDNIFLLKVCFCTLKVYIVLNFENIMFVP